MSISTYADLQTALTNWTKRSDLSSYIPDFITLGEARINREVKAKDMEQRTTSTMDSTTPYLSLPSDFSNVRAVFATSGGVIRELRYMAPGALLMKYPQASADSEPSYYTIIGSEMRFGPWPDSNYTVEYWYYKKLAALSGATNTLFTNNPDLYLYAALTAAMPFMKDDKRIPLWEAQYQAIKNQINDADEEGRRGTGMAVIAA